MGFGESHGCNSPAAGERPLAVRMLPNGPGVYRFRDAAGLVLYIGRASVLTLSYELAARIRDEITALTWITRPQRAATLEAANLAIAGWADGILVEFQIRDGRLDAWSQRPCDLTAATPGLTATPLPWRDFAEANAELAARLSYPILYS